MHRLIFASLLMFSAAAVGQPSPPTEAEKQNYITSAESWITSKLKDPDSAKFGWPNRFVWGTYKSEMIGSPFSRYGQKYTGWISCGTVNAKNAYGGYAGASTVIVVGDGMIVNVVDMDDASDRFQYVAEACSKLGF